MFREQWLDQCRGMLRVSSLLMYVCRWSLCKICSNFMNFIYSWTDKAETLSHYLCFTWVKNYKDMKEWGQPSLPWGGGPLEATSDQETQWQCSGHWSGGGWGRHTAHQQQPNRYIRKHRDTTSLYLDKLGDLFESGLSLVRPSVCLAACLSGRGMRSIQTSQVKLGVIFLENLYKTSY